jgi:predicted aspartyl protease
VAADRVVRPRQWAALALAGLLAACASPCTYDAGEVLPVTVVQGLPMVPVQVNGATVPFLLDTGATNSVVLPEAVERLQLPSDRLRTTRGRGIGGSFDQRNALLNELRVGQRALRNLTLPVITHAQPGQRIMAGVLGADFLQVSDVEIDMPARRATLHEARSCLSGLPPWEGEYDTIPIGVLPGGWVALRVEVEGNGANALLDTGAAISMVRQSSALRLGAPAAALSAEPSGQVHGAGQDRRDVRLHRFRTVRIGQETLRDVPVGITPLPETDPFSVIIGQDYMQSRRLWLSYARQRLYVQRVR